MEKLKTNLSSAHQGSAESLLCILLSQLPTLVCLEVITISVDSLLFSRNLILFLPSPALATRLIPLSTSHSSCWITHEGYRGTHSPSDARHSPDHYPPASLCGLPFPLRPSVFGFFVSTEHTVNYRQKLTVISVMLL